MAYRAHNLLAAASFLTAFTGLFFTTFSISTVTIASSVSLILSDIFHDVSPKFQAMVLLQ